MYGITLQIGSFFMRYIQIAEEICKNKRLYPEIMITHSLCILKLDSDRKKYAAELRELRDIHRNYISHLKANKNGCKIKNAIEKIKSVFDSLKVSKFHSSRDALKKTLVHLNQKGDTLLSMCQLLESTDMHCIYEYQKVINSSHFNFNSVNGKYIRNIDPKHLVEILAFKLIK